MKKRIITMLLLGAMLLSTFAACSSGDEKPGTSGDNGKDQTVTTNSGEVTTEFDPDDRNCYVEPEARDYSSMETFTIMSEAYALDIEETSGDALEKAMYNRNRLIEEKYGIKIVNIVDNDPLKKLRTAIMAQDGAYDAVSADLYNVVIPLMKENYLVDLSTLNNMDLSSAWYDQTTREQFAVNGEEYYVMSPLDVGALRRTIALAFNKDMMDEYVKKDIYQIVKDGKWTFDEFESMAKTVSVDLNGDGTMDYRDSYGFLCGDINSSAMFFGCGQRIAEPDDETGYKLVMNNEESATIFSKIIDFMYNTKYVKNVLQMSTNGSPYGDVWQTAIAMFKEGRVLFRSSVIDDFIDYRDMDVDFGIVPYPKYTEEQESYWHISNKNNRSNMLCIPVSARDVEYSAALLDALSFESKFTTYPAFYDITLNGKVIRDNESEEMLDIIFTTLMFDPGFVYNFGDISGVLNSKTNNFASSYASRETAALTAIEELMKLKDAE